MEKFKVSNVLIVVAIVAIIAVSFYGIKYFNTKIEESKTSIQEKENKISLNEPQIILPEGGCDIKDGYVRESYSIGFNSGAIDKDIASLEKLINESGGIVLNKYDNRYPVGDNTMTQRSYSVSLNISNDNFKDFSSKVKKLSYPPNFLDNESMNQETESNLEMNCRMWLDAIAQSIAQEKIYINQLQDTSLSFEAKKEIINILTNLRLDAQNNARSIQDMFKNIKQGSSVYIYINEILG